MPRRLNRPGSIALVGVLLLAVALTVLFAVSPDLHSHDRGHVAFGRSADAAIVTAGREVSTRTFSIVPLSRFAESIQQAGHMAAVAAGAVASLVMAIIVRPLRI